MDIQTESLPDDRIKVTDIKDALTRKELPPEYVEHVPYMVWRDEPDYTPYLLVNWVGGIDHVHVGRVFNGDAFRWLRKQIDICESKLQTVLTRIEEGRCVGCGYSVVDWNYCGNCGRRQKP